MYHPKVSHQSVSNNVPAMRSTGDQPLFYFGGAQTPVNFGLKPSQYQGSQQSFSQAQQVDANTVIKLTKQKRSPAKVVPGSVGRLGVQTY